MFQTDSRAPFKFLLSSKCSQNLPLASWLFQTPQPGAPYAQPHHSPFTPTPTPPSLSHPASLCCSHSELLSTSYLWAFAHLSLLPTMPSMPIKRSIHPSKWICHLWSSNAVFFTKHPIGRSGFLLLRTKVLWPSLVNPKILLCVLICVCN